jgi:SAM-dependent methyltransferase
LSTPSASDVQQIYKTRFSGAIDYRKNIWKVLTSYFARWVPPDSAVLDLGCGYCEFINTVAARKKFGMDLNPEAQHMAHPEVTIIQQDCSEPWRIGQQTLDVVFTSNFFEHLPDKTALERTLTNAYNTLRPGGRMIMMGPNIRHLPGAYWDFFDHFIPLSEYSLAEACKKCGFSVELSVGKFLPYTMSQGRRFPVWTLSAYLKCPFLWRVAGKQFLVIVRKS